ncbi:alpha/beta hydrolase [Halopseudomonas salegens]|uniref:Acetyl esterase/lipase n=1 Tax=Halopseudomonas salegens TaxID=1434072 RepID=A0A1H2EWM1_9GAMM|nr:alpha/beta hydrolase [Halopseudomonas salegens]SDT99098.1 Acetyl esterase/lipase [Halopseudomonas salegens]
MSVPFLRAVGLASLSLLTACSPLAPINAFIPDDSYQLQADQAYGTHKRQHLDVYFPAGDLDKAPVALFFYGGSWRGGSKDNYTFVGEALAARGIIAVIADYRVYPDVTYPDFLHDSAAALAWVIEQRSDWQPQPGPLVVMGHSAGAYNAAMLALDPRWLARHGLSPTDLDAWVALAGPFEFLPILNPRVKPVFHHPETPLDSQPIEHVGEHSPPALLMAARPDRLVDPERNTQAMADKLSAAGVAVDTHYFDSRNHFTLLLTLAHPFQDWDPVLDITVDFIHQSGSTPAD